MSVTVRAHAPLAHLGSCNQKLILQVNTTHTSFNSICYMAVCISVCELGNVNKREVGILFINSVEITYVMNHLRL